MKDFDWNKHVDEIRNSGSHKEEQKLKPNPSSSVQASKVSDKPPTLKQYVIDELLKRGINKFTRKNAEMSEEIQQIIMQYTDSYNEHYVKTYLYAWFDFGRIEDEQSNLLKQYFRDETKGKDGMGSVNHYNGWLDGLLLLTHEMFEKMSIDMREMFQPLAFEKLEGNDITYRIHDKWGRPN